MANFKCVFFLLMLLASPLCIYGDFDAFSPDNCFEDTCCDDCYCLGVQARASAYFPFERKVQRIYSKIWGFYEGEIDIPICSGFGGFFSAGYLENSGRSICVKDKTSLRMVPLVLGLKYFCKLIPQFEAYVSGGVVYSFLNIRDHSPYVHRHISKNAFGGTAKLGLAYYFCSNWFIDASVDYLYQYFRFKDRHEKTHYVERHNLNMSGIKVGVGIGYAF